MAISKEKLLEKKINKIKNIKPKGEITRSYIYFLKSEEKYISLVKKRINTNKISPRVRASAIKLNKNI